MCTCMYVYLCICVGVCESAYMFVYAYVCLCTNVCMCKYVIMRAGCVHQSYLVRLPLLLYVQGRDSSSSVGSATHLEK